MRTSLKRVTVSLLLGAVPPTLHAQVVGGARIARAAVAAQAMNDLSVWGLAQDRSVAEGEVTLDTVRVAGGRATVLRGRLPLVSHWRPYLVAMDGDGVIPLGGFQSPMLSEFTRRLPGAVSDSAGAMARADLLTIVADPNGAVRVAPAASAPDAGLAAAAKAWSRARPRGWPADAVIAGADGGFSVTRTVLSARTWDGAGEVWVPMAYSFRIASDGAVESWSRREAAELSMRR